MPQLRTPNLPEMYNFPLNFYDRPEIMVNNILRGDLPGSIKSIFQPQSLSPEQRKQWTDKFKDDPLVKLMLETATNPLVVIGAVLSLKYPVLKAAEMFKYAKVATGSSSGLGMIGRFLSTPDGLFAQFPKVLENIREILRRCREYQMLSNKLMTKQAENWRALMPGKPPTKIDEGIVALLLQGDDTAKGNLARETYKFVAKHGPDLKGEALLNMDALAKAGYSRNHIKALKNSAAISRDLLNEASVKIGYKPVEVVKKYKLPGGAQAEKIVTEGHLPVEVAAAIESKSYLRGVHHATSKGGMARYEWKKLEAGKYEPDYFPHRLMGPRALVEYAPETAIEGAGGAEPGEIISPFLIARRGGVLPDMKMLDAINAAAPGVLNPKVLRGLKQYQTEWSKSFQRRAAEVFDTSTSESIHGKLSAFLDDFGVAPQNAVPLADRAKLLAERPDGMKYARSDFMKHTTSVGEVPQYSIRAFDDINRYIYNMAPVYASTVPGKGETQNLTKTIIGNAKGMPTIQREILYQDYLPQLRGRKTEWQGRRARSFRDFKLKYFETLQTDTAKKTFGRFGTEGEKVRQWLSNTLSEVEGSLSPAGLNAKITGWLYFGAMGLNPSPALKNLTQPMLTTAPLVGWFATLKGMANLLPKLQKHSQLIKKNRAKGMTWKEADDAAMEAVFKDFRAQDLIGHPQYTDTIDETLKPWVQGMRKYSEGAKDAGMAMFTATERFNRLLSWEAAMAHAQATSPQWFAGGAVSNEAVEYAAKLVRVTQFPGGFMGVPHGMLKVPGTFRQFTQFPLRMLDFLGMSTKFGGQNRDFGTVGRALLYSTVAYEGLKQGAGVDISEASLIGALPSPLWREAPFYPFPLVPPALSVAGGVAHAAFAGEYNRLPQALAVAVPGGLAIRRAYRTLRPSKADYGAYSATGQIPVYTDDGRLVKHTTPMGLFMKSIGVRQTDDVAESQMADYLSKQKIILREYRIEYLKAIAQNNLQKAAQIQAEFKKKYPTLGPIQIKKSDIQTIHRNRMTTRLDRMMRQMPVAYRPLFGGMAGMAASDTFMRGMSSGSPAAFMM